MRINLSVDAAVFSCDTELLASVGEVDLQISCTITANPAVHVNSVSWTFSQRNWNLTNGRSKDGFSSHIVVGIFCFVHLGPFFCELAGCVDLSHCA